jgi:hypothetical protein
VDNLPVKREDVIAHIRNPDGCAVQPEALESPPFAGQTATLMLDVDPIIIGVLRALMEWLLALLGA